jgi:vancomycin permeability regulator SanA
MTFNIQIYHNGNYNKIIGGFKTFDAALNFAKKVFSDLNYSIVTQNYKAPV